MIRLIDVRNGNVLGETTLDRIRTFLGNTLEEEDVSNQYVFIPDELFEEIDEDYSDIKHLLNNLTRKAIKDSPKYVSYGILGFQEIENSDNFCIKGRITDKNDNKPLGGLLIEAYEKGLLSGDFLGWAFSNENGDFEIFFGEHDFQMEIPITLETKLEIKLLIFKVVEENEEELYSSDIIDMNENLLNVGEIRV
ncbi:MAG: hypothetical protein JXA60_11930 [Candidatus Coatesbacteria bacterium]|nr:hypothetical protein [Candidatus Coatesbacteria bacterium]